MKKYIQILGISAATCALAAPPTQMQEGLWEITTQAEVSGAATKTPPETASACYSKQDVENESPATPKDEKCEIQNYRVDGNIASWDILCSMPEKVTGSGTVTFHNRTSYSGTAKLRMEAQGKPPIQISNRYSGKRLGECRQ
jgi:hypothetical protein